MLILCCGPRAWEGGEGPIRAVLSRYKWWKPTILHGGAKGVDSIAGIVAFQLGYKEKEVLPNYSRYGRGAPFQRNLEMLNMRPDLVIAWGIGNGTNHTCRNAELRNIPLLRYY